MRLLQRCGNEVIFVEDSDKPYAILSHTWGELHEEVTYDDVQHGCAHNRRAFHKLDFCLSEAAKHGCDAVWIDTCCIDRRDKNELSEAINLMFQYYQKCTVCIVYLADISFAKRDTLSSSRWFTRGWTLQELLAPRTVNFYSSDGHMLGNRSILSEQILIATGIDTNKPLEHVSLAERFRWSLKRHTTKPEDTSYCLTGLLGVSLIPNYGEGEDRARQRLLDEVREEHGRRVRTEMEAATQSAATVSDNLDSFIKALPYPNMHARRLNITMPYPASCKWLLQHQAYKRWIRREVPFLWIKGKPGAGKSTLVKFADTQEDGSVSFYFNARGDQLEQSTTGLYRSILHQILKIKEAQTLFATWFERASKIEQPTLLVRYLQDALYHILKADTIRLRCFIDALDECHVGEVQEVIHFLQDIMSSNVSICFASRYYPTVTIPHSIELRLEEQSEHAADLEKFVHGRLDTDSTELKQQVLDKANGVFFWAVLVVPMLNKELGSGSLYNVQKTLSSMPTQLSDLLREIIARDQENIERFKISLQWLLFSRISLTPVAYYNAVILTLLEAGPDLSDAIDRPTRQHHRAFVSSSSRGLAETTGDRIQFIHESVRDFLFDHGGLKQLCGEESIASIHEKLKQACLTYLRAVQPQPLAAGTTWRQNYGELKSFYDYSVNHALYHAEQAATEIDQEEFLRSDDLNALIPDPGLYANIKELVRRGYGRLLDIVYTSGLAYEWYGPHRISRLLALAVDIFDEGMIKKLISLGADINDTLPDGRTLIHRAAGNGQVSVLQLLLRNGAKPDGPACRSVPDLDQDDPSYPQASLSKLWHKEGQSYMEREIGSSAFTLHKTRPIVEAAYHGHLDALQMLAKAGAEQQFSELEVLHILYGQLIEYNELAYETVSHVSQRCASWSVPSYSPFLQLAKDQRHGRIVDLLIQHGALGDDMTSTGRRLYGSSPDSDTDESLLFGEAD